MKRIDLGMDGVGYGNCDGDAVCHGDNGELAVMTLVMMEQL